MTFWQFASDHPVLAVIFVIIGAGVIESIFANISNAIRKN